MFWWPSCSAKCTTEFCIYVLASSKHPRPGIWGTSLSPSACKYVSAPHQSSARSVSPKTSEYLLWCDGQRWSVENETEGTDIFFFYWGETPAQIGVTLLNRIRTLKARDIVVTSCWWCWPHCRLSAGGTSRRCSGLSSAGLLLNLTCIPHTPARTPRFHRWTLIAGSPGTIPKFLQIEEIILSLLWERSSVG